MRIYRLSIGILGVRFRWRVWWRRRRRLGLKGRFRRRRILRTRLLSWRLRKFISSRFRMLIILIWDCSQNFNTARIQNIVIKPQWLHWSKISSHKISTMIKQKWYQNNWNNNSFPRTNKPNSNYYHCIQIQTFNP